MSKTLKIQVTLPYEKSRRGWGNGELVRPTIYQSKIVSENVGKDVTIEFEIGNKWIDGPATDFGSLQTWPQAITMKNVDAILEIMAGALSETNVPNRFVIPVIDNLLSVKGWYNYYQNFTILDDQRGFGYMGGAGCGKLIHDLTFSKILGVNPELTGVRRTLAAMQFNGMLGEVKEIRRTNKHLREALAEDHIFVTLNARPMCQATVRYRNAHGYPVVNGATADCSCTKCCKKLNVVPDAAGRRRAGAVASLIKKIGA